MTAKIIDGKQIAKDLLENIRLEIIERANQGQRNPCLAVILVGDDPASEVYVRNKKIACEKVGIKSLSYDVESNISQAELLAIVNKLNADKDVDGILV
ncbi:MAG: tetrahydrofolate dehydrogenase/cyclohydrolase catalytic domain-containing protein, partial [Pseudomonadales bacterium]